jgi:hypothetical protein
MRHRSGSAGIYPKALHRPAADLAEAANSGANSIEATTVSFSRKTFIFLLVSCLAGCGDYWWTRGQPQSGAQLFKRASKTYAETYAGSSRADLKPQAQELAAALEAAITAANQKSPDTAARLQTVLSAFIKLEDNLSIGSRPPYAELTGQLRALITDKNSDAAVLSLYGSRVLFFLANELTVPPPNVG